MNDVEDELSRLKLSKLMLLEGGYQVLVSGMPAETIRRGYPSAYDRCSLARNERQGPGKKCFPSKVHLDAMIWFRLEKR